MEQYNFLRPPASCYPDPLVLYFHHVGDKARKHYTSITTAEFIQAIDVCSLAGHFISPSASGQLSEPGLPIILTFDDGYAETVETVLPILEARGIISVFFVNTARVNTSEYVESLSANMKFASWPMLQHVSSSGHYIASHGHTHRSWLTIDADEVIQECRISLDLIREHIGEEAWGIAYPYGEVCDSPISQEQLYAFGTSALRAAHWRCRPKAIRRVFLPKGTTDIWLALLNRWCRSWQQRETCIVCSNTNNRSHGGTSTHA